MTALLYEYKVRWIEDAAACPIFSATALITYCAEGDRGHLFKKKFISLNVPTMFEVIASVSQCCGEEIMKRIGRVEADTTGDLLPHNQDVLSTLITFCSRVVQIEDLDKFLPQARLRPHVVSKLCIALLESGYFFKDSAQSLRIRFEKQVGERYPFQLQESFRQVSIPQLVDASIRESLRPVSGSASSAMKQKHATPTTAPMEIALAMEDIRPPSAFPDRHANMLAPLDEQEFFAKRKQCKLSASTDWTLVPQWKTNYFAEAFPFTTPRLVGGADLPWKTRARRPKEAPELVQLNWARMLASRVEASIRNDWLVVPCGPNRSTKHKMVCGKFLACKNQLCSSKAGIEVSETLTEAAQS